MLKVVQVLLQALLPLLERRVLAAERTAVAAEQQLELLKQFFAHQDSSFAALLGGYVQEGEELAGEPDVTADYGSARDLKAARLEELRALWHDQQGELLDDDRLMVEYERLYEDAEARMDPDQQGVSDSHFNATPILALHRDQQAH